MFGSEGPHGVKAYRQRRQEHNKQIRGGSDCFHFGGKESQAVLNEHTRAARQVRCDPVTSAILRAMPRMLHVDPTCRPTALELRDHFKDITSGAKDGAALSATSSTYQAQTRGQTPSRKSTKPPSTPGSPLGSRKNARLSGHRRTGDNSASSSQNIYAPVQTDSPRAMTMDDKAQSDVNNHSDVFAGALDKLQLQIAHSDPATPTTAAKIEKVPTSPYPSRTDAAGNLLSKRPVLSPPSDLHTGSEQTYQNQDMHSVAGRDLSSADSSGITNISEHSTSDPASKAIELPRTPELPHTMGTTRTPEPPLTPRSSVTPKPPARLSFQDALEWKRRVKDGGRLDSLANYSFLKQLKGRDHVSLMRRLRILAHQAH